MKKTKQTKFPVARIKKIMQTDEDVGKVAMATPVLVSKALELFMASIVGAAVEETRAAGSKKMTPYHLKRTVLNTPMFDFLQEQVSSIPDPVVAPAAGPSKPRGRKKKAPSASASSSDGSSSEDDKPAPKGRRPSAKKAKVEVPALPTAIPPLPTVNKPFIPSVFAPPPIGLPGLPTPGIAPPPPPVPALPRVGYPAAVSKQEEESDSGSESGSEDDE